MQPKRRQFIQQSTLAALALITAPAYLKAADSTTILTGIQLYSVRDQMKTDPLGTLKAIASMGYKHIEHANYIDRKFYGYTASEFKKIITDLGLKMPSGHTVLNPTHWDASKKNFTDAWKYTIEDAATLEQQLVISPSFNPAQINTLEALKKWMDVFNESGKLCKKWGMRFGYHNHDFEFSKKIDNQILYDLIVQYTDKDLVVQQLDIGNLYGTGADALSIVKKYPGRFISLHVKDEIKAVNSTHYESTILGKGVQNVKTIIDEAKKLGTLHFIVEQEAYQGLAPIDCIKRNFEVMREWGY